MKGRCRLQDRPVPESVDPRNSYTCSQFSSLEPHEEGGRDRALVFCEESCGFVLIYFSRELGTECLRHRFFPAAAATRALGSGKHNVLGHEETVARDSIM